MPLSQKPKPRSKSYSARTPPDVSFIGMVDFTQQANWIYMTHSVSDLLGWEVKDLIGTPSLDLVHPDELLRLRKIHYDTIIGDKAACVVYIRMRHKNPDRGYIVCGVSRTVCHNVVVGSVSYAIAPKGIMMASTAQEVTVLAPTVRHLFATKWNDPDVLPLDPLPEPGQEGTSYGLLPAKSFRTALFLNRFSIKCNIDYCSNDLLISSTDAIGRSVYDFVERQDQPIVEEAINTIKGLGVNDVGQPSTGGFVFRTFRLLVSPRDTQGRAQDSTMGSTKSIRNARRLSSPLSAITPRPKATLAIERILVDSIWSAHSDGILVILRRSPQRTSIPPASPLTS